MTWYPPPHLTPSDSAATMLGQLLQQSEAKALGMVLGQLLERSEQSKTQLDWIVARLEQGDTRMDDHGERLKALETKRAAKPLPGWERMVKGALPYLLGLATLWGTGSIETALKVLGALK